MLIISRKVGESILIGDDIEVIITDISGEKIKLGINAPKNIRIMRNELIETENTNIEANNLTNRENAKKILPYLKKK